MNKINNHKVVLVSIHQIFPNRYQKQEFRDDAKIAEIAESLRANRENGSKGLLQIPTARVDKDGLNYELAFGHHRWYAFQSLEPQDPFWSEMPLLVEDMTDQQMFEALATENLKRRDINPMEKAEMYRTYMETFGKTSVEAAQFFHTTEEDIRGTTRLGNLVPAAQELVRSGQMNVSLARTMLTAQKVLSPTWTAKTLEDIQKNTWGSPQTAIHNALNTDPNSARIDRAFEDWQKVKKFPVKYLAPVQKKQIAEILDVQKDDKARKQLLDQLMTFIVAGMEFADADFPSFLPAQLERVRILTNPPACESCSLHVALNGEHYCGLRMCFDRKSIAWQQAEIVRQAKELGISLYVNEETDGKAIELNRIWDSEDRKLFENRNEDLRLKPTTRTIYNNFPGVPQNLIVVITGKTAQKRLKKQEQATNREVVAEAARDKEREKIEREQEARAIKIQFLVRFHWEVASPAFASALEGVSSLSLLHQMLEMMQYARDAALPDQEDDEDELVSKTYGMKKADGLRQMRRIIMHHAIYQREEARTINAKKPVVEFANACQEIAKEWGVKLGRTWMAEAEKYQADLDAAIKELNKKAQEVA